MTGATRTAPRIRRGLGLVAAATVGLAGALVVGLGAPAAAVDDQDIKSVGQFSNPLRPENDTSAVQCVTYGTGDPVTYNTDVNSQSDVYGAHNEIRSGLRYIGSGCNPDETARTGLGFTGVTEREDVGEYVEMGRFTQYNRTVQDPLHFVDLTVELDLGGASPVTLDYTVEIQESPDFRKTPDTCQFQPGDTNRHAGGAVVPDYVAGLNADNACADSLYISPQANTTQEVTIGETLVEVELAGWAYVDANGVCDASTVVNGPVIYTAEAANNELCLLVRYAPADVSITKNVVGEDNTVTIDEPEQFWISLIEVDQPGLAEIGDDLGDIVDSEPATPGVLDLDGIDPGLYLIQEDWVDGWENGPFVCTRADGSDAIIVRNGNQYLDVDSNADITCAVTNTKLAEVVDPPVEPPVVCDNNDGVMPTAGNDESAAFYRFASKNRVLTALYAAKNTSGWCDTAILASSVDYADALAAAPLADALDAPILLANADGSLDPQVQEYLVNEFDFVVIASGPGVIPESVRNSLNDSLTATDVANVYAGNHTARIAGVNRYETAATLAVATLVAEGGKDDWTSGAQFILADGQNFPDALAAGPAAAAATNGVILLTAGDSGVPSFTSMFLPGQSISFSGATLAYLPGWIPGWPTTTFDWSAIGNFDHQTITVVGGAAKAAAEAGMLGNITEPVEYDDALVGADRYETATLVATKYFGSEPTYYTLASGEDFPDAVVAGGWAANADGPLVLTRNAALPKVTMDYLVDVADNGDAFVVFGGTGSVSMNVSDQLEDTFIW